ncbi:MAG: gamma-glutamylcyclotransferase [Pseudomonadota bacterium]|nr:gamma-glutamylcyclotransferase [Pseudomonadota bacterium]
MAQFKKDIWVFGYGSLMWRPDFSHIEMQPALLRGYHRSLCVYSIDHRGTKKKPGIVLGLDRGGACKGLAMRVKSSHAENVLKYLHKREMKHEVYCPRWLTVRIPFKTIEAYCFIVDRNHSQYAGKLDDKEILKLIRQGSGRGGDCFDYLSSTIYKLEELGIVDKSLQRIFNLLKKTSVINSTAL